MRPVAQKTSVGVSDGHPIVIGNSIVTGKRPGARHAPDHLRRRGIDRRDDQRIAETPSAQVSFCLTAARRDGRARVASA
jgi:hypothetical protein